MGRLSLSLAAVSYSNVQLRIFWTAVWSPVPGGESDVGGVAADDRRNVDREGLSPGGSRYEIGDSERQRIPIVAQVGMHHVAAMQVDARAGEVDRRHGRQRAIGVHAGGVWALSLVAVQDRT